MADKSIFELTLQTTFASNDRLVVGNYANSDAEAITGQTLVNLLATSLDGHGGIQSIVKSSSSGTDPVVDTYTITMADTSTTTFTVTNGQKGDQGLQTFIYFRWAHVQPSSWSDTTSQPDEWMGVYAGTATTPPTTVSAYTWVKVRGETGETGQAASISSQSVTYMESTSGTIVPSGSWSENVPSVTPGNFLWTRTQLTFNDGSTVTSYSISRYGIDGTGAVSSVNGQSPDTNGNVSLTAKNVPTSDNLSIQAHITAAEDDIDTLQSDMTDLDAAFNDAEPDIVKEYHVGVGQEYTTLRAGIEAAVQRKNSRVIVHPGIYDLKTEFATELAQSSITEYTGNALYNGVHIIGMAGAIVTAIFTGSESNIWQIYTMFSPFFAVSTHDNNDYTIENLVIRANNTRYCVHDDPYGEGTYVHKYINCDMGYYNAMSPANYVACIGGGLGEHSVIVIEGGAYTSTTEVAMSGKTLEDSQIPISFHNSSQSTAQSWIHIHGVELKNLGHFEFYKYGSSTEMSYVFLSNCRVGKATVLSSIDASSADNMSVSEFNMTKKYGQALVTETVSVSVTAGNDYCYVGAKDGYNLISAIFAKSFTEIGDAIDGITWSGSDYILFLRGAPSASETRQAILTWVKND